VKVGAGVTCVLNTNRERDQILFKAKITTIMDATNNLTTLIRNQFNKNKCAATINQTR